MANRKQHLKRQAARRPEQSITPQSTMLTEPKAVKKTVVSKKAKPDKRATPVAYTQLSPEETRIVWLELRHILMTACIILAFFFVIWLVFHYTNIDDKIYSFLHLIPKSS